MHIPSVLCGLSAIGGIAIAQANSIEPDNFNVTSALEDLGVVISDIPALQSLSSLQSRSSQTACSIAVSEKYGPLEALASALLDSKQY
jgi:hypothetical protein